MINYIQQPGGVTFIHNGAPVSVAKTDKHYEAVLDGIKRKAASSELVDLLQADARRMAKATEIIPGITLQGGQLYHMGEAIAGVLGARMLQMLDEGFDLEPMARFLGNLLKNPSRRVVEHLYGFLEAGKSPITEDGCFLAYKAVRADWLDIHSGKFSNVIGAVLEMPRHRVDEDPHRTCSTGFHVCSFDYLRHFAHADGHVVVCKVNPCDVVAIPADYNNTKMRTAKYEVVAEYEDYYDKNEDFLAKTSVFGASFEGTFVVEERDDGHSEWAEVSAWDSLLEAAQDMMDRVSEGTAHSIRLTNSVNGAVLDLFETEDEANDDDDSFAEDRASAAQPAKSYHLRGYPQQGSAPVLLGGLGAGNRTLQEAVLAAVPLMGSFFLIEICDENGSVVTSIR